MRESAAEGMQIDFDVPGDLMKRKPLAFIFLQLFKVECDPVRTLNEV